MFVLYMSLFVHYLFCFSNLLAPPFSFLSISPSIFLLNSPIYSTPRNFFVPRSSTLIASPIFFSITILFFLLFYLLFSSLIASSIFSLLDCLPSISLVFCLILFLSHLSPLFLFLSSHIFSSHFSFLHFHVLFSVCRTQTGSAFVIYRREN